MYLSKEISLAIALVLILPGLLVAAVMPTQHTIDFSQSDNLKAVFDAGLRPWLLQGAENSEVQLAKGDLRIILPETAVFTLDTSRSFISVLAENKLYSMDLFTEPAEIALATMKAKEICQGLGINSNGLDAYVSNIGRGPAQIAWSGETKKAGIYVQVRLVRVPSIRGSAAEVEVTMEWPHEDTVTSSDQRIKPPPGYENVSMEPPDVDPTQKPFPEHDAKYYLELARQAKAQATLAGAELPRSTFGKNSQQTDSAPRESGVQGAASTPMLHFFSWAGLVLLLVLLGIAYFFARRNP